MSTQNMQYEKTGKRMAHYCDLEGQDSITCDYEQHGTSIISERLDIPSSSQHLDLVGKSLCRKHYNKFIVNAEKSKTNVCSHPKHEVYLSTARHGTEGKKFKKAPERLVKFFNLSHGAMMCHHCLYVTDNDSEFTNLSNYLPATHRIPTEYIKQFRGRSYVLRSDVIYSESEFQELESAYHEVCAELDEATKLRK